MAASSSQQLGPRNHVILFSSHSTCHALPGSGFYYFCCRRDAVAKAVHHPKARCHVIIHLFPFLTPLDDIQLLESYLCIRMLPLPQPKLLLPSSESNPHLRLLHLPPPPPPPMLLKMASTGWGRLRHHRSPRGDVSSRVFTCCILSVNFICRSRL